ncbi:MAG: hypothetical protein LBK26_02555 [Rickettsiales bacterium]|jgi:hypothetical protein|nr:hypothetical protein [Rickettsiales bacterium]
MSILSFITKYKNKNKYPIAYMLGGNSRVQIPIGQKWMKDDESGEVFALKTPKDAIAVAKISMTEEFKKLKNFYYNTLYKVEIRGVYETQDNRFKSPQPSKIIVIKNMGPVKPAKNNKELDRCAYRYINAFGIKFDSEYKPSPAVEAVANWREGNLDEGAEISEEQLLDNAKKIMPSFIAITKSLMDNIGKEYK